jgi:hypothetical protein
MPEATATVKVTVSVPWDQPLGGLTMNVVVSVPTAGGTITQNGIIYLTVTGQPSPVGIPEAMTYLFLFSVCGLSAYAFLKKRR